MTNLVQSKKTYANTRNALKAAAKHPRGVQKTHTLPSGRVCFYVEVGITTPTAMTKLEAATAAVKEATEAYHAAFDKAFDRGDYATCRVLAKANVQQAKAQAEFNSARNAWSQTL